MTREGAEKALEKRKKRETKLHKGRIPSWVKFDIDEMEVLE